MRATAARFAARLTAGVLRRIGRSATTVPGRVALAIDPGFLSHARRQIGGSVSLVSATNGKTTTSTLAAAALKTLGPVSTNAAGANMSAGIAAALAAGPRGPATAGLFEVDEFWLPDVASPLAPDFVVLSNLFRDQLDRYGELDAILDRWAAAACRLAAAGTRLIACADDPGVVWALRDVPEGTIEWFGFDDPSASLTSLPDTADAASCRRCGNRLDYEVVYLGHLGKWRCSGCGLARPEPAWRGTSFVARGARGFDVTVEGPVGSQLLSTELPGLYNAYNALAACSLASLAGVRLEASAAAFGSAAPAFGRGESFELDGTEVRLMLIKNPTGANEVIRSLVCEDPGLTVQFSLNDRTADGNDVSWIWDSDFEQLVPRLARLVCSGTRADEAALRFKYAGLAEDRITVIANGRSALAAATGQSAERVWVLPTYTAMIELRAALSGEGRVRKMV